MGYQGYFLIVWDFIRYAREEGIPVGPGRGSAAGSLVAWCMRITDVDPIDYDLLFERFLNPERISLPDIDVDFCERRRGEVIDYVTRKYGRENVAQIITFGTMKAKAVVRDVGRVLEMSYADVDRIAKQIPAALDMTLDKALAENPVLKDMAAKDPKVKEVLDIGRRLEGMSRHASVHAAGVVIAPGPITDYAPLYKGQRDEITTQWNMKEVERVGLLKMDFLGLSTLTLIDDALKEIKRTEGIVLDIDSIPLDDAKTYKVFQEGAAFGIFQFESSGMRELLRKAKPDRLDDLIALNALYRPGPLKSGMVDDYIARKQGLKEVKYDLPQLAPILQDTYGVIAYQEQVMLIAQALAGFSLAQADMLRKAMGKKDPKVMAKMRADFMSGAMAKGINEKKATKIFDLMEYFAGYGFNKSHSTAYAFLAYQTAYLKANYTAEFMAANMNSEMQDTSRLVVLLNECKQMGVEVLFPDINRSEATFRAENGKIVYGLAGIKNVGLQAVEALVAERVANGPFTSLFDLCKRVNGQALNRRALESLILAGALPDELPGNRAQQFAAVETALAWAAGLQADRELGQVSLFDLGNDTGSDAGGGGSSPGALGAHEPPLPDVDPWPYHEMLEKEKEVLGLYLSGHPLEPYRVELEGFATSPLDPERLGTVPSGTNVILGGMITRLKQRISPKDNRTFAFADLEDFTGKVDVAIWSDVFESVRHQVEVDSMVLIRGALTWDEERRVHKLTASKVLNLSEAREKLAKSVHMRLRSAGLQPEQLEQLKEVCTEHPGECRLVFHVETPHRDPLDVVSEALTISPEPDCFKRLQEFAGAGNVWLSAKSYA
jgi:DNA polymerase-3 subunit alpha